MEALGAVSMEKDSTGGPRFFQGSAAQAARHHDAVGYASAHSIGCHIIDGRRRGLLLEAAWIGIDPKDRAGRCVARMVDRGDMRGSAERM